MPRQRDHYELKARNLLDARGRNAAPWNLDRDLAEWLAAEYNAGEQSQRKQVQGLIACLQNWLDATADDQ